MKKIYCLTLVSTLLVSPLQAEINTYLGIGYFSAGKDISNAYDDLPGLAVKRKGLSGFNVNTRLGYIHDSGFRVDAGIATGSIIGGDIAFINFPINLTVGYQYPIGSSNIYARAGVVHNIISGDYIKEKSATAPLIAVGFESDSFFIELAADNAKVTFEQFGVEKESKLTGLSLSLGYAF